jgi:hypothetical protein
MWIETRHRRLLKKLRAKGAPAVRFALTRDSGYDAATAQVSEPDHIEVTGLAIETTLLREDFISEYRVGELIVEGSTVLLFVPDTLGEVPELSSAVEWAGERKTVKGVRPLRPTGTALAARVVIA